MSEKFKTYPGNQYYLTMTLEGWIDLFTRKEYAEFLEINLNYCIENKGLEVFSYCIMPSHLHMITRTLDYNLSDWLRDYKSYTSRKLYEMVKNHPGESRKEWLLYSFKYFAKPLKSNKEYKIWHNGNHPEEIFSQKFYDQKEMYIHNNPVEAGLVTDPQYYRYSSANPNCAVKIVKY
ncbi:MAG TPA: transposase [Cytophagaceae bacterium]|jgi:putative transposase|nr:transposase [Cytophagaceae bacterium]